MTSPEAARAAARAHKLWGGRFAGGPAPALEALNRSIGVDLRLWPHDIELSKAWAMALWNAGVLSLEESTAIERGLERVAERLADGESPAAGDEDVHTLIDRLLHEEAGEPAGKLHTGRSRNDQVATATRLWTIEACRTLDASIRDVQQALFDHAHRLAADGVLMPAYTHLQRSQPVSAAHWVLSHFWPLERDRARLSAARAAAGVLPLGSGAVAGCAFPVSRVLLKESLGFSGISPNSIDAVSDRDFVAEMLFTLAMVGTHLSRLAEDLIIYGSSEFGFVRFGDAYTTGSSMMPQKRNPDVLELARQSGARMLGDLVALLATLKGLPTSYNKDLQEDKRVLFDAVDGMLLVLPAVAGAIGDLTFDVSRMRAALSSTMMATDLADYLVDRGVPFREAHASVGRLVREAEEAGVDMSALPPSSYRAANPAFGDDALESLSPELSVARRAVAGATGPDAVREQLDAAREALVPSSAGVRGNEIIGDRRHSGGTRARA